jgi:hypothetical protein
MEGQQTPFGRAQNRGLSLTAKRYPRQAWWIVRTATVDQIAARQTTSVPQWFIDAAAVAAEVERVRSLPGRQVIGQRTVTRTSGQRRDGASSLARIARLIDLK